MDRERKRHRRLYRLLLYPVKLFCFLKFGLTSASAPKLTGPYIVISNHTTNYDPLFVGVGMKKHMYFVASEHVYRRGRLSAALRWGLKPIARVKGATDASAAIGILRAIKSGDRICIFAEGNSSWNGLTGEIHPTTARLVKAAKVPLVTYKLQGGYLSSPRWSGSHRRGKIRGEAVSVYSAEQLAGMTDAELAELISADIFVDAFAAQEQKPIKYRGKRLAEKLETALYVCPECSAIGTLKSAGKTFFCDCGMQAVYDETGFFSGPRSPFKTVAEWDAWQSIFMHNYIAESEAGERLFEDEGQSLYVLGGDHSETQVAHGRLCLYEDRLTLGDFTLRIEQIQQMSLHGRETIVFSAGAENYEIRSAASTNGRKYETAVNILKKHQEALNGLF